MPQDPTEANRRPIFFAGIDPIVLVLRFLRPAWAGCEPTGTPTRRGVPVGRNRARNPDRRAAGATGGNP